MKQTKYNCTQAELYAVARTGWNSYTEYIPAFTDFRGFYLPIYADNAKAEVDAASSLPDDQARYAHTEILRNHAVIKADLCFNNWQKLKRYISTSFIEVDVAPSLVEAGSLRYPKAVKYNWEELNQMNTQANNFITNHFGELIANDNMPAAFQQTYADAAIEVAEAIQTFIDSEESDKKATAVKIDANNAIYTKLMDMFKDGQELYKDDEAVYDQFVFDSVLGLISGARSAGLRGVVTDAVTTLPLAGVAISVIGKPISDITDTEGKYMLKPMASGDYTITATKAGYETLSRDQTVLIGTVSHCDLALNASV